MFLYMKKVQSSSQRKVLKTLYVLQCDFCQKEFESNDRGVLIRKRNFCNTPGARCRFEARKSGNIVANDLKQTCLDRYGVENKSLLTKKEKPPKITKEERNQQRRDALEIGRQNLREKYNVTCPSQVPSAKEKLKQPKSEEMIEARKETCIERYGVSCPLQQEDVKQRANSPAAHKKRHETMKRNNSYVQHKTEKITYQKLCTYLGEQDLEPQILMNDRWPIDFYIKSLDVYVQIDGVYWHGLNRPIEEIQKFEKPRDVGIFKKMQTDKAQNIWFAEQGLKLVRITDVWIRSVKFSPELILSFIREKLNDNN